MFEYWFNFRYTKLRYRLDDIGKPVDVELGAGHEESSFGGELGYFKASMYLAQGTARLSVFSGYCNWRSTGNGLKLVADDSHEPQEKVGIVCLVKGDEAFVIIDKNGLPLITTLPGKMELDTGVSEGIRTGKVVDFISARTTAHRQAIRSFPDNPPKSPYL